MPLNPSGVGTPPRWRELTARLEAYQEQTGIRWGELARNGIGICDSDMSVYRHAKWKTSVQRDRIHKKIQDWASKQDRINHQVEDEEDFEASHGGSAGRNGGSGGVQAGGAFTVPAVSDKLLGKGGAVPANKNRNRNRNRNGRKRARGPAPDAAINSPSNTRSKSARAAGRAGPGLGGLDDCVGVFMGGATGVGGDPGLRMSLGSLANGHALGTLGVSTHPGIGVSLETGHHLERLPDPHRPTISGDPPDCFEPVVDVLDGCFDSFEGFFEATRSPVLTNEELERYSCVARATASAPAAATAGVSDRRRHHLVHQPNSSTVVVPNMPATSAALTPALVPPPAVAMPPLDIEHSPALELRDSWDSGGGPGVGPLMPTPGMTLDSNGVLGVGHFGGPPPAAAHPHTTPATTPSLPHAHLATGLAHGGAEQHAQLPAETSSSSSSGSSSPCASEDADGSAAAAADTSAAAAAAAAAVAAASSSSGTGADLKPLLTDDRVFAGLGLL